MVVPNMNVVTIFERAENVHLNKDVGQILYYISKNKKYNAELWSFCEISNSLPGVKIRRIETVWKRYKLNFKLLLLLVQQAKNIELLNLYHVRVYSLIYAYFYKLINPKGVVFIKGDFDLNQIKNEGLLYNKKNKGVFDFIKNHLIKKVDIVTFEHKYIGQELLRQGIKSIYIPNGVSEDLSKELDRLSAKASNKITPLNVLVVGRIGSYQKNTEEALDILLKLHAKNHEFYANIVGPIDSGFKNVIDKLYYDNPSVSGKINFIGEISDLKVLARYYNEADIFLLTSRFEGYPLSVVEAGYACCIPVVSQNSGADDLIENYTTGYIYKDTDDAVEFIISLITDIKKINIDKIKIRIRNNIIENNDWEKNISFLLNKVDEIVEERCE
ncbi:UDP-D-galactose:(glucosyl)lipopolysaccharide-1,6-D-galactosyltransferase [Serratia fonticola]|nr:UDP-D-galactose:(glucosyl)lipopolysaccharide-1,6-D-galactosyltransferase [Serratia fonticola]